MNFTIQRRQENGKWYARRIEAYQGTLDAAVAACCLCDEDGLFPSDLRVIDMTGTVVMTCKMWREQFNKVSRRMGE